MPTPTTPRRPAGDVDVKVKPRVAAGASTIATGTVTVAAYAAAIVAFASGARDEVTLTTLILGTVSLLTFALGRVAQAVAAIKAAPAAAEARARAGTMEVANRAELADVIDEEVSLRVGNLALSGQGLERVADAVVAQLQADGRADEVGTIVRARAARDLERQQQDGMKAPGPVASYASQMSPAFVGDENPEAREEATAREATEDAEPRDPRA